MTSHDAVARIRRIFGTRAVGHAGTLDPAAAGVLPLAIGKATRLLEYLVSSSKTYIGEATFGVETDSLDQCGSVLKMESPILERDAVEAEMTKMVGPQMQVPPAFSAVKHQGRPLYEYARQGQFIEKPARPIEIFEWRMLSFTPGLQPRCRFLLHCSKGTYVRALVRDLAYRLGTVSTLTFLLRAGVGELGLGSSYTLEELTTMRDDGTLADCLLPPQVAVSAMPAVTLSDQEAVRFVQGQTVSAAGEQMGLCAVYQSHRLLGIGKQSGGLLRPHKVLTAREDVVR
jgi:tRNA pseudouridine55 synthase